MCRFIQMNEFEHRSLEFNTAGVTRSAVTTEVAFLFFFLPHARILIKGPFPPKKADLIQVCRRMKGGCEIPRLQPLCQLM